MNVSILLGMFVCGLSLFSFAEEGKVLSEEEKYTVWAQNIWDSLDRKTGAIKIEEAGAVLNVPESFYYLDAQDAKTVLVDVWGNPPGSNILGMLFPADVTPFDSGSWAVTIEYEEDGYVSDEDAGDIDYSDLLTQMKEDTLASSNARVKEGYEPIALVGWASAPYYDNHQKKLYWAKEIKFGNQETNTLNYNIRVLGRKGVLVLNFIAGMDQKSIIDANIDTVLALAEFEQGAKYSDFDPDIDQIAAYGLGALVAGKVIAKTGFLAVAFVFLKKFGLFILIAAGAFLRNMFIRKKNGL
jgi:uncharacterized membrane-anchored protein